MKNWTIWPAIAEGITVQARTKSEARAALKRALGYKHRLPVGVKVIQL